MKLKLLSIHGGLALLVVCSPAWAAPLEEPFPVETITATVSVIRGPVNGVVLQQGERRLAIYGHPGANPPPIEQVLFTHHRREVAWAGVELVQRGAKAIVPAAETNFFLDVNRFWAGFWTNRFHDYKQQSSRILTEPLREARGVRGGETLTWQDLAIEVLDTPGYTRGAVSYLFESQGKRVACVGDLIYGDGQFLDLHSLQDAIPEAKEDGYHGFAARAADVMNSLRQIANRKPDILIPARGPVILNPTQAIGRLCERMQNVFANHFANDALRWYRGEARFGQQVSRIFGNRVVPWMDQAETIQTNLPSWIIPIGNSRLLLSQSGAAFLVDCGSRQYIQELTRLQQQGRFKTLEGVFITHYHDDHTDAVPALVDQFPCPVYACREMQDILEHPGAYRLPALTANPIRRVTATTHGATQRWHEFDLTFSYFPGQTLYHGGLLAKKDGGESVFFIGDSFVPTGLDDYCLLNRNLFEPEPGYSHCLEVLRQMKPDYLLINEHVMPAFRFSARQLDFMIDNFRKRKPLLAALFPWDDANYGVDESWARFYPYGSEASPGQPFELKFILRNHSPSKQKYQVTLHLPDGWKQPVKPGSVSLAAHSEGSISFPLAAPHDWRGLAVITADIRSASWDLRQWTEAMVRVK